MRLFNFVKIYYQVTRYELLKLYEDNKILVNDKIEKLTYKLNDNDIVKINNKIIKPFPFEYYIYYKPKGILSMISNKPESYINNINIDKKMMIAGRLDKDSEGLILLSNDPCFINMISGDKNNYDKEYIVTLKYIITDDFLNKMNGEFILRNKKTKKAIINKIDNYNIRIILNEGMYHQIRKMVILSNNRVINLKRIRIGKYNLDSLNPGETKKINA